LTFNGHKIHYDWRYATEVEKYPGLVVHGPLQALLLFESAKQKNPQKKPASFKFRAMRPLFDFDTVYLAGQNTPDGATDVYTADTEGNIAMQATVTWK
jgi:3-methylfumaryl-CoA hydratase